MDEYELASLAYRIERIDLGMKGGQQDQYAAAFGGLNFMEFHRDGSVLVNPLRIRSSTKSELESSLLLYYTGVSRFSASIIQDQISSVSSGDAASVDAMNCLKEEAMSMKRSLLRGELHAFYSALNHGWEQKKRTSKLVSNRNVDSVVEAAMNAGAVAAKLSGAGGGGFIVFFVSPEKRQILASKLTEFGGKTFPVVFTEGGSINWSCQS
jgi:D-glycero-alpha-D-manno-heptose-7-phosphate kinase